MTSSVEELEEPGPPCVALRVQLHKIHSTKFSINQSPTTMSFMSFVNTNGEHPILEAYCLVAALYFVATFAIAFFGIVLPSMRKFFYLLVTSLRITARLSLGIFTAAGTILCTVGIGHSTSTYQSEDLFFIGPIQPNPRFIGPILPSRRFIGSIRPNLHFIGPIRPNDRFVGPILPRACFIGPVRPNNLFVGPILPDDLVQTGPIEEDLAYPDPIEEETDDDDDTEVVAVQDQHAVRIIGGMYAGESCYIQERLSVMARIKLVGSGKVTCIMPRSLEMEAEQKEEVAAVEVLVPVHVEVPVLRRSARLAAKMQH